MYEADDEVIEKILEFLFKSKENFTNFPINLVLLLSYNPKNRFKIMNALVFILTTPNYEELKSKADLKEVMFPQGGS